MEAKKIATIVLSVVLFAVFVFFIVWTCLNWDTFKKTFDGTKLYTYDDVETAYDDGYSAGAKDKTQYELIITEYKEQIANLSTQRTELLTQITTLQNSNKDYSTELQNARTELAELNNQIAYYEKLLEAYETMGKLVATFMYNNEVYAVQLYDADSNISIQAPANTEYLIFNGWTVNSEIINLETYTITEDTTFVADITYRYAVQFVVNGTVYDNQIITKNDCATLPATPVVAGQRFVGWSIDNANTVNNITATPVTQHTTYYAVLESVKDGTYVCGTEKIVVKDEKIISADCPITESDKQQDGTYSHTKDGIKFTLYYVDNVGCWIFKVDNTLYYYTLSDITKQNDINGTFSDGTNTLIITDNVLVSITNNIPLTESDKQFSGKYHKSYNAGEVWFTLTYIEDIDCWMLETTGTITYLVRQ